ncbi:MAG: hypothetical protein JST66_13380 [Bacteroidetes bacterium]|nr:hypothetical protein [Bacteroidota bacterium]
MSMSSTTIHPICLVLLQIHTHATGRTLRTGVLTSDRTVLGTEGLVNGTYHLTLRSAELLKSIAVQVVR